MIQSVRKRLFILFGFISLVVGFIGIFVPILPTTPFMILAAWCFKNGSDKLHAWILRQPKVGPAIEEWEQCRVIRPRAKVLAVSLIVLSIGYVLIYRPLFLGLKVFIALVAVALVVFISTRRNYPNQTPLESALECKNNSL